MISFIRRKLKKYRDKRTFATYGYRIDSFDVNGYGKVEFAHWLHPFNKSIILDSSTVNFYKEFVNSGDLVLDIGAYTGDTTVPMALAAGPEGTVIAYEPNRYAFDILAKNASLNPEYTHIIAENFAATSQNGLAIFNYSDASFCNGGFLSEIENQRHHHRYQLEVQGKNIQEWLFAEQETYNLKKLSLIKIDAEGYDKEILKTIPKLIDLTHPVILVECYKKLNNDERFELYDILSSHGYDLYRFIEFKDRTTREKISREKMLKYRHFEIMACYHP